MHLNLKENDAVRWLQDTCRIQWKIRGLCVTCQNWSWLCGMMNFVLIPPVSVCHCWKLSSPFQCQDGRYADITKEYYSFTFTAKSSSEEYLRNTPCRNSGDNAFFFNWGCLWVGWSFYNRHNSFISTWINLELCTCTRCHFLTTLQCIMICWNYKSLHLI